MRVEGVLKFDLTDEGEFEFQTAMDALKWRSVVEEMDRYLKASIKHSDKPNPVIDALQQARDHMWSEMNDDGITLWD